MRRASQGDCLRRMCGQRRNGLTLKHLLPVEQELTVDRFIPNDTYVNEGCRVAVITGANGSGKSVYLKQVCLRLYAYGEISIYVPGSSIA